MRNAPIDALAAPWLRLSMRAKGAVLIAIPIAALLFVLGGFAYLQREQQDAEQWALHTQQVQIKARELLTALVDGQSAIRGYALTGQSDFLGPFQDAEQKVPAMV